MENSSKHQTLDGIRVFLYVGGSGGMGIAGELRILTLSHEDTRRRSLWLEKRRLEMPSEGGWESSRPPVGVVVAVLMSAGATRREIVHGSGEMMETNRGGKRGEGQDATVRRSEATRR